MTFKDLSLEELIGKIKSGETTAADVKSYFLERAKKYDGDLNTFNFLNEDVVINDAD
jgi:Asp-tRNA(Asn)/Glu-tRNA(Gln) amidotransferase A subunit family amidase